MTIQGPGQIRVQGRGWYSGSLSKAERLSCESQGLSEGRGALKSRNPQSKEEASAQSCSASHLRASASQKSLVPLGLAVSPSSPWPLTWFPITHQWESQRLLLLQKLGRN